MPFSLVRTFQCTRESPDARNLGWGLVALTGGVALAYALLFVSLGNEGFANHFELLSPHTAIFVLFVAGTSVLLWQLHAASPTAFRAAAPLFGMVIFGPIAFYLHWPYLW